MTSPRSVQSGARYAGRVAVITGAGSGIGAACARRLAQEGAAVLVSDINGDAARQLADELSRAGARAAADTTEVSDESAVSAMIDRAVSELGGLDVLINNAGVGEQPTPIDERPAEDWHRVMRINLDGVFFGTKHAARVMKKQGRGG